MRRSKPKNDVAEVINGWTVKSDSYGSARVWDAYKLGADGYRAASAPKKPGCYWAFDTKREAIAFAKTH